MLIIVYHITNIKIVYNWLHSFMNKFTNMKAMIQSTATKSSATSEGLYFYLSVISTKQLITEEIGFKSDLVQCCSANMIDILVEIPDHKLPKLLALYEEKAFWAPYMVNFVHCGIKWKKSNKYKDSIVFLSPNNCWEEDGTIIVTITLFCQDIIVFTLDDHCVNLYKGLMETNRINVTKMRTQYYAVHEKHIPTVKKYIGDKKLNISADKPSFIFAISVEQAKNFSIECPPDVYVKKLDSSAAKLINEMWPHAFPDSDQHIASYIDINGGYGVFLKSTNELVSWVMKHAWGHLGVLQTKEEHTRKGYANLVVKALSKDIAEEGLWTVGNAMKENEKSINMFEKLGFRRIGACTYIAVE